MNLTESFTLTSVFVLAMTTAQPFGSELASIFSLRASFLLTQGLFITGTVVCALSKSSTAFLIGRAIQGAGAGAAEPVKAIILLDLGDVRTRARGVSYLNFSWLMGIILGPLVGGYVVEQPALGGVSFPYVPNFDSTDLNIALDLLVYHSVSGRRRPRGACSSSFRARRRLGSNMGSFEENESWESLCLRCRKHHTLPGPDLGRYSP